MFYICFVIVRLIVCYGLCVFCFFISFYTFATAVHISCIIPLATLALWVWAAVFLSLTHSLARFYVRFNVCEYDLSTCIDIRHYWEPSKKMMNKTKTVYKIAFVYRAFDFNRTVLQYAITVIWSNALPARCILTI